MDAWVKRQVHVEGPEKGQKGGKHESLESQDGEGATGTVNVGVSASTVNIATTQPGTVNIGMAGAGTTGSVNIGLGAATVTIANNVTSLILGGGAAAIGIANGPAYSGNIGIASTSATRGTIDIGNVGSAAVTIGSVGAPLYLRGSTVDVGVSSSIVNIGTSPVGGIVYIGNGTTGTTNISGTNIFFSLPTTGTIGMGVGAAGTLNLGNTGTGNFGVVNISTGGATNISTNGTGSTIIGNTSAPLTLRGSSTTFSSALTLGAAPTTNAHLGFWVQGVSITTSTSNTANSIYSISLTTGNWIIFGNAFFPNGLTFVSLSISSGNNTNDNFYQVALPITGSTAINITRGTNIISNTTFYLVAQASGAATLSSIIMYAMRIG